VSPRSKQLEEAAELVSTAKAWSQELSDKFYALKDAAPEAELEMFGAMQEIVERIYMDYLTGEDIMVGEGEQ